MVLASSSSGGILALQYVVHFSFMDNVMARNSLRSDVKKAYILKVTQQRAAGLIV